MENTMENNNEKFDRKLENEDSTLELLNAAEVPKQKAGIKFSGIFGKAKSAVVLVGARTVVVIASVLLIGAAVILNYTLAGDHVTDEVDQSVSQAENSDREVLSVSDTYFASSMLSRKQARDEAIEVLKTVVNNEAAIESAKETALSDISRIAGEIETEANIETLIKSKGFEECIAVVTGSNANIIVKSDGLLANELSQIKEIVYEQAGIDPINIKIVEKN